MAPVTKRLFALGLSLALLAGASAPASADLPRIVAERIYSGSGTIDLRKEASAAELGRYFNSNGSLFLGLDLRDDDSRSDATSPLSSAIKQVQLLVTTTAGTFSFTEFSTAVTARLQTEGEAQRSSYKDALEKAGLGDLQRIDDILQVRNVAFTGSLLGAKLVVKYVNTSSGGDDEGEKRFDFSKGFEDYALLNQADAAVLETGKFEARRTDSGEGERDGGESDGSDDHRLPSAPGTPAPPLLLLGAMAVVVTMKARSHGTT